MTDGLWDIPIHRSQIINENFLMKQTHPSLYSDRYKQNQNKPIQQAKRKKYTFIQKEKRKKYTTTHINTISQNFESIIQNKKKRYEIQYNRSASTCT